MSADSWEEQAAARGEIRDIIREEIKSYLSVAVSFYPDSCKQELVVTVTLKWAGEDFDTSHHILGMDPFS